MKVIPLLSVSILILLLFTGGCDKKQEVEPKEEIRPVKTMVIKTPGSGRVRNFPGRVDADKKAALAFRVSGNVNELLVREGDLVVKGDVIAKLDPTDFQIAVDNHKASFSRAEKDYLRGKKLVKEGHISKMDFDTLEANFLSTQADLKLAEQQLAYTELVAPFDGSIAKRYIQKFEEVQAKQEIVTLNDNEVLEIKMDVPENLILNIQRQEGVDTIGESRAKDQIPVFALFQSKTGKKAKKYPLKFKEIATKADAKTQTFAIAYTLPKPDDIILLPGMTASVEIDLTNYMKIEDSFYLPVSAVVADVNMQGTVWIVDEESMEVQPVSVKVGVMDGNRIQVKEGLKDGQRVVVAGVPFLYKGLKVSLLKESEQAKDNLQHQSPTMNKELKKKPNKEQSNSSKEG